MSPFSARAGLHLASALADPPSPTDGELYSATLNNFLGTEPVILRNMGPHHAMKTEYLAFWLNGEHWCGSGAAEAVGEGGCRETPGTPPLTLLALPQNPTS